jgi:hypothetical protein
MFYIGSYTIIILDLVLISYMKAFDDNSIRPQNRKIFSTGMVTTEGFTRVWEVLDVECENVGKENWERETERLMRWNRRYNREPGIAQPSLKGVFV